MAELEKYIVNEKENRFFDLVFYDQAGTQVPRSAFAALTLSLFLKDSSGPTYVNSRNAQDVFGGGTGTNNCVIDTAGKITWTLQAGDLAILTSGVEIETHVAVFQLTTTSTPALVRRKEIYFFVDNFENVT